MTDQAGGRDGLVVVADVVKPHGIRGELCIQSYADSPALFGEVPAVYLRAADDRPDSPSNRPRRVAVISSRAHHGRVLLTLEGVTDRDKAEALRGLEVCVAESDLPEPDPGEVYLHDILGSRVVTTGGEPVGRFEELLETGAQDVWVIRTDDGREVMLPAVEAFVADIDPDEGLIVIDPPEGLLDLYLADPEPRPEAPRRRKRPGKNGKAAKGGDEIRNVETAPAATGDE